MSENREVISNLLLEYIQLVEHYTGSIFTGIGQSINRVDATGEEKLRALTRDLRAAGITLMLAGLKKQVREALERARLQDVIGEENIFASKDIAVRILDARFKQQDMEAAA